MAETFTLIFSFSYRLILTLFLAFGSFLSGGADHKNTGRAAAQQSSTAPAVCNISADETITICGTSRTLTVDAGQTGYTWNNGATTPSITVTSSGTYYWEKIDLTNNAVENGDFTQTGAGSRGFTSEYTYVNATSNALVPEGRYSLPKSPKDVHNSFADFPDHTKGDGTGRMMVVNGASTANVKVWEQDITVLPNTTYVFSIWGASAYPTSPGDLKFSINGTQLGNIQLSTSTGVWQNFTVRWTSGASTSATIAIVNQNTASTGNDFALDDIVFAPICRKYFNVTLNPYPPKPDITSQIN